MAMDLIELLRFGRKQDASDLHISADAPLMLRRHGETIPLRFEGKKPYVPDPKAAQSLIYSVLTDDQKRRLEDRRQLDFAISLQEGGRFRGAVFYQQRGLGAVFRFLSDDIPSLEQLGLPQVVHDFVALKRGLVLVTGPTGSGKSTTLAAMVDTINRTRRGHILTIEDPIEYVHRPRNCMVNQREVGIHATSFEEALRGGLREDPDVILVGEMRDLETIALAITAAETGHLVLSTLHTSSAAQTVERIVNVFPEREQSQIRAELSYCLEGVISQLLLPRITGGRVAAFEVLVATTAIRALIREGKTAQIPTMVQTGRKQGMQSLERSISKLAFEGRIEKTTAQHYLISFGLARFRKELAVARKV